MGRGGLGNGIVGAVVIANAVDRTAGRKTRILWMICGWSVIIAFVSVIPIASYSFSPELSMFGMVVALTAVVSFAITLFIGLMLLVFKL